MSPHGLPPGQRPSPPPVQGPGKKDQSIFSSPWLWVIGCFALFCCTFPIVASFQELNQADSSNESRQPSATEDSITADNTQGRRRAEYEQAALKRVKQEAWSSLDGGNLDFDKHKPKFTYNVRNGKPIVYVVSRFDHNVSGDSRLKVLRGEVAITNPDGQDFDSMGPVLQVFEIDEPPAPKKGLHLASFENKYTEYGGRSIVGIVHNDSTMDYRYVEITFRTFDASGAVLGDSLDNISGLSAGEKWRFEAHILDDDAVRYELNDLSGF